MKTQAKKHRNHTPEVDEIRFSDSIKTDDRGMVRLHALDSEDTIVIQGRKIKVKDIPLSNYTLECGHFGQGIAVAVDRAIYCEKCADTKFVVKARS